MSCLPNSERQLVMKRRRLIPLRPRHSYRSESGFGFIESWNLSLISNREPFIRRLGGVSQESKVRRFELNIAFHDSTKSRLSSSNTFNSADAIEKIMASSAFNAFRPSRLARTNRS